MNRKKLLTKIIRTGSKVFDIVPINNKRILFTSYSGKQFSCNPKYIYEYMKLNYPNYEYVWAFNDPDKYQFLVSDNTKVIKYNSLKFVYESMTAMCIITNVELSPCVMYRGNKQLRLNTWHGGGCYKLAGYDTLKVGANEDRLRHSYGLINTWVSSSTFFSQHVIAGGFRFHGKILETGMPRNDILTNEISKKKRYEILKKLGLEDYDRKIILYAPSFRELSEFNSVDNLIFDYEKILELLKDRDKKDYYFLCRAHHYMKSTYNSLDLSLIDVSNYPDMQELLSVADILITDYSSVIWDYSIRNKEIYLYTPDLDQFVATRSFYKEIHEWGFPVAVNEEKLQEYVSMRAGVGCGKRHIDMLEGYECGKATEMVTSYIVETMDNLDRKGKCDGKIKNCLR